ncbi:zinc metallo ase nas-13-like [Paramuricea clavata]|uniref:Metalloendopeptidase n=1 Tax=Paramuricea clavata TaxID=317549 RepID=A0A7D9L7H4_PARCT|nr:zinc metallo ase nas-13-like [Paramuricea clavata]
MKAIIVTVGALTAALFISCCVAVGPFELPDDKASPPPTYDFNGFNMTLREGDIVDRGGDRIGEAAAVGVPWKNGRIPYVLDCSIKNLPDAINSLNDAIKAWHDRSPCIRFVPKQPSDEHFVTFFRAAGCWASDVGYRGRNSFVSIGHGCEYKHVMVHELGHVIGFWHEQSRPDRDKHVRVVPANILPSLLYNFDKVTSKTDSHGEDYDYASIMHYPFNAFALDRARQTLIPLQGLNGKIPYVKLSDSDVAQANKMYNCDTPDLAKKKDDRDRDCIDEHPLCSEWANANHCFRNPEPLLLFCKKSCDNCGPCIDESLNCPKRYDYFDCVGNANFALRECKATCRVCKPDPTPRPTKPPTDPPTLQATDPTVIPLTQPSTAAPTTVAPTTVRPEVKNTIITRPDKDYFGVICLDRNELCEAWKNDGRCEADQWVYRNCLVQCNRIDICDIEAFSPTGTCASSLGLSRYYKNVAALPDSSFQASSSFYPGT